MEQLLQEGTVYNIKFANTARKRVGLAEIEKNDKAVEELNILADKIGLERGKCSN